MANERDTNEKKKLPGWAITLIIIASLIVLILLYRMIRQLLRMRRRKLSGIEFITVTPQSKARALAMALRRQKKKNKKALHHQEKIKKLHALKVQNERKVAVKQAQNKKTSDFQKNYEYYIDKVKKDNPGLSKFEINDLAASGRLSDLTSKQEFDIKKYKQFIKQIPTNIKKEGNTGVRIQAIDRTINGPILKDMNDYLSQATNPTLNGAIAYIEKDSLQNLVATHTGRSPSSYIQLYRPFYQQALQLKKRYGASHIKQMQTQNTQKATPILENQVQLNLQDIYPQASNTKSLQVTNPMRNKNTEVKKNPSTTKSFQIANPLNENQDNIQDVIDYNSIKKQNAY